MSLRKCILVVLLFAATMGIAFPPSPTRFKQIAATCLAVAGAAFGIGAIVARRRLRKL